MNSDVLCVLERPGFPDRESQSVKRKFFEECRGEAFREGFDQVEMTLANKRRGAVGDLLVIDGVLQIVPFSRFPDRGREGEIEDEFLLYFPFPRQCSDDAARFQSFQEDLVSHGGSVSFRDNHFKRRL